MTRQNQVVRASGQAGLAARRDFPAGTQIFCRNNWQFQQWSGYQEIAVIPVVAGEPYQRFYVSATINGLQSWADLDGGGRQPELVRANLNADIGNFGDGHSIPIWREESQQWFYPTLCMTGSADLRAGPQNIRVTAAPDGLGSFGRAMQVSSVFMNVIVGQIVEAQECGPRPECA